MYNDCDINARCLMNDNRTKYQCVCNTGYDGDGKVSQKMESMELNDFIVILIIDFSYQFYCQLRSSNNAIQGYYIFGLNIHK
jgi:hypothetical protein